MTFDDFFRTFRRLGNSAWCRYWLSTFPGKVAIDVLDINANQEALVSEMMDVGFETYEPIEVGAIQGLRFYAPRPAD